MNRNKHWFYVSCIDIIYFHSLFKNNSELLLLQSKSSLLYFVLFKILNHHFESIIDGYDDGDYSYFERGYFRLKGS